MNAPSGALVAYATAPGAVAFDGNGSNGLYTRHLARVLRQPGLPVEEVFKQVRTAVRKESGNQQTPWENTALEGQFVFNAAEPAVAKPQPIQPVAPQPETPVRKSVESLLWESVKDSTNAAEVMTYTERYPNGSFSAAASARLALLQSVRPAPAVTAAFQIDRGVGHLTVKDALESKAQEMEGSPARVSPSAQSFASRAS